MAGSVWVDARGRGGGGGGAVWDGAGRSWRDANLTVQGESILILLESDFVLRRWGALGQAGLPSVTQAALVFGARVY